MTFLAGNLAVTLLRVIRCLPPGLSAGALSPLLPLYPLIRPRHARRLARLFEASPFAGQLTLASYYRARLRLMLRSLHLHGRALRPGETRMEGREHYQAALSMGRPVALVGLHMGVVELLHRFPERPPDRPYLILTAPAFSGALTDYLAWGRERDGKGVQPNRGIGNGVRTVLSGNGVLALMADQVPDRPETFLDLWGGIRVPYPARLLDLLGRQGCSMVPVTTRLEADGASTCRFHAPLPDGAEFTAALRRFMEEGIAWAPEQWNWSYPKNHPLR